MADSDHPRLILHNFLSPDLCKVSFHSLHVNKLINNHHFHISILTIPLNQGFIYINSINLQELEFIHKSCSTIGYRQNVFSTTLSHLIATNCPHLILPFIPIRGNRLNQEFILFNLCRRCFLFFFFTLVLVLFNDREA